MEDDDDALAPLTALKPSAEIRFYRVFCNQGVKIPIRNTHSVKGEIVGYVHSSEEIGVVGETKNLFLVLAHGKVSSSITKTDPCVRYGAVGLSE
jgi:hypothetical protein